MHPEIPLIVFSVSVSVLIVNFALLVNFMVSRRMIEKYKRLWKYVLVGYKQMNNEDKTSFAMVICVAIVLLLAGHP
jgi:hypothetical protein